MSLTLALDTVTGLCACALYQHGVCLARLCDDIGKGHGEHLIGQIEMLISRADIDKSAISHIGVNTGPGSFTGMRIGVATVRALGLALQIKAVGVNRFEAIRYAVAQAGSQQNNRPCAVILPAVQDQFSIQIFEANGTPLSLPYQATVEEIIAQLPPCPIVLSGNANETIAAELKNRRLIDVDRVDVTPEAELDAIAAIATAASPPYQPPIPLYMRPADAKPMQALIP